MKFFIELLICNKECLNFLIVKLNMFCKSDNIMSCTLNNNNFNNL